jgi:hypothetical protein
LAHPDARRPTEHLQDWFSLPLRSCGAEPAPERASRNTPSSASTRTAAFAIRSYQDKQERMGGLAIVLQCNIPRRPGRSCTDLRHPPCIFLIRDYPIVLCDLLGAGRIDLLQPLQLLPAGRRHDPLLRSRLSAGGKAVVGPRGDAHQPVPAAEALMVAVRRSPPAC